jgi:hypothetical protein
LKFRPIKILALIVDQKNMELAKIIEMGLAWTQNPIFGPIGLVYRKQKTFTFGEMGGWHMDVRVSPN